MGPSSLSGRTSSTLDLIVTVLEKRTRLVVPSLAHPASEKEQDTRQSNPVSLIVWSGRQISMVDVGLLNSMSLRFWSSRQISRLCSFSPDLAFQLGSLRNHYRSSNNQSYSCCRHKERSQAIFELSFV